MMLYSHQLYSTQNNLQGIVHFVGNSSCQLAYSGQFGRNEELPLRFYHLLMRRFKIGVEARVFNGYRALIGQHTQQLDLAGGEGVLGFSAVQGKDSDLLPPDNQRHNCETALLPLLLINGFYIIDDYRVMLPKYPVDDSIPPLGLNSCCQSPVPIAQTHGLEILAAFVDGKNPTTLVVSKALRKIHQGVEDIIGIETGTNCLGEFVQIQQFIHGLAEFHIFLVPSG